MTRPLFSLGRILATPGVLSRIDPAVVADAVARHRAGDWGDLCEADREENDFAVKRGCLRVFSAYRYGGSPKFWIITEANRSATTILLPEECRLGRPGVPASGSDQRYSNSEASRASPCFGVSTRIAEIVGRRCVLPCIWSTRSLTRRRPQRR